MAEASGQNKAPIIKKVKKVAGHGHHGGAWKVAYADFVTAMMAFFLLMWLLNATSEEQRKGLADFFSPSIPLSQESAGGEGMLNGNSVFTSKDFTQANFGGSPDAYRNQKDDPDETGEDDVEAGSPEERGAELPPETAADEASENAADLAAGETAEPLTQAGRDAVVQQAIETAFDALQRGDDRNELLDHLAIKVSPEGLMIEIADRAGAPLFSSGSAAPSAKMRALIDVVAPILAGLDNELAITGHTDATPFASGATYGNWELSSDRANAARRMLLATGLPSERIVRVSGAADTDPLTPEDRFAAQNRRIAITLMRRSNEAGAP